MDSSSGPFRTISTFLCSVFIQDSKEQLCYVKEPFDPFHIYFAKHNFGIVTLHDHHSLIYIIQEWVTDNRYKLAPLSKLVKDCMQDSIKTTLVHLSILLDQVNNRRVYLLWESSSNHPRNWNLRSLCRFPKLSHSAVPAWYIK